MSNKKIFSIVVPVLICLVSLLPTQSFSVSNNNKSFGLYFTGQYKPSIPHFTNFSVKEANVETKQLFRLKHNATSIPTDIKISSNFTVLYSETFQENIVSFSGAVGYLPPEGPRVEIEGSYEKFDIKNPKNDLIKDAFRYIALAREVSSSSPQTLFNNKYVIMRNDGISIISIILNLCYDFFINKSSTTSPYICAGFGGNFIELFNSVRPKFAYQGKLGINHPLSSNVILFVDGYYHKVMGNKFKHLSVQHIFDDSTAPKATSAIATINIEYFGAELGLKFIF